MLSRPIVPRRTTRRRNYAAYRPLDIITSHERSMFFVNNLKISDELESEVRSYCRSFATVFTEAKGYRLRDDNDKEYIDFFSGAGALNYGHNPPQIKKKLIEYLAQDGIVHSLDMATEAKKEFLKQFNQVILNPRKMKY